MNTPYLVSTLGLLTAAVLLVVGPAVGQGAPPTLVVTEPVKSMEFHDQITLTGRTEAWVTSRIVAEIAGRVELVNAGEGRAVRKDDPLMTIDCLQMEYAVKAKAAEAEQARLKAMLASDALERAEDLFARHLIPETTADSARTWATITEQSYFQIEADHQRLAVDYDHCTIRAPFAGYTGRKLIDVGEWVNPGTPVFELVDIAHIRVRVDLPERLFGQLSISSAVTVQSGDRGNADLSGKVIGISPNASEETHTFPVIIDVPNPDARLAGGMLVRATLSLDNKFAGLAVSKDALVRQGAQTMVYTVVDGKAVPVPVVTTSTNGDMVAVQSEMLREGTAVVVRGNERIYPGAAVTVSGAPTAPEQVAPSASAAGH